jgi:ammonium transporter, Amt family
VPTPDGADTSTTVKGLFYGGGWNQLKAQFVGSATCCIVVFGVALLIMFGIKQIRGSWTLRIDKDGELEGLDIVEHGTPAYHVEFGYGMSYTTPTGATVIGGGKPLPIDLGSDQSETQKV